MLLKKIIKSNDLKEEKIMVARQAMQDQEIPDFIEHKQIVAVFDLPENAKTMVKENMGIALLHDTCYQDPDLKFIPLENMPLYHWYLIKKKETYFFITKKFYRNTKKRVLIKYSL